MPPSPLPLPGFRYLPDHLDADRQRRLAGTVLAAVARAGWFRPCMPRSGRPFSVEMCNLGPLGWVADRQGYRYQAHHPATGLPWPALPPELLALWHDLLGAEAPPPEACLVNRYDAAARMGLHQDRDEAALDVPVLSVSLGDTARFRLGGQDRRDPTRSLPLRSGDVVVLGGELRSCFHGIDRVLPGTSSLLPGGGRLNLTLRRVTPADTPAGAAPAG